jgi:hypothetical protein
MKHPDKPGVSEDYGGEVTVKRTSPLPLIPTYEIKARKKTDFF